MAGVEHQAFLDIQASLVGQAHRVLVAGVAHQVSLVTQVSVVGQAHQV